MKLNDVYPEGFTGKGIFSELTNAPWYIKYDSDLLDLDFFSNYGERIVAPLLEHFYEPGGISDINRGKVAKILMARFGESWARKYNILSLEYAPIENYSMIETEKKNDDLTDNNTITTSETTNVRGEDVNTKNLKDARDVSGSGTGTSTGTNKTTNTKDMTDDMTTDNNNHSKTTNSGANENKLYGFNSSTSNPSDENSNSGETETFGDSDSHNINHQTGTDISEGSNSITSTSSNTGKDTLIQTGTDTHNITNDTTKNNTLTGQNTKNNEQNRTLTRSGNIGVTTSQQMIQSEIELWAWNFFEDVMQDIKNYLTIPIYGGEED